MSRNITISKSIYLQLSFLVVVLYFIYSCQKHELTKDFFCGQKYKIWLCNDPENIQGSPSYIVFRNNERYEEGIITQDIYQDCIIHRFGKFNVNPCKWEIRKDTLLLNEVVYFPVIKHDTLKFKASSKLYWTDYTDFIELNGDSLNQKSRLTNMGFDKLYFDKYHLSHDTLSRAYFDKLYMTRKMTTLELKEYEKYLIKRKARDELVKKGKIEVIQKIPTM